MGFDHSDLIEMASTLFQIPTAKLGFCTTASLKKAIMTGQRSYLEKKGW
jgi:hypothetical protein